MRSILLIGNHLRGAGRNPTISEDLARRFRGEGLRVFTASSRPSPAPRLCEMLHTAWRFRTEYELAQIDMFSGRAFLWAEAVASLLLRIQKPYVLTLHGGALPTFARKHPGRMRRILRGAAAVTAPSAYLQRELGGFRSDIQVVPNPIEIPSRQSHGHVRPSFVWIRAFKELYAPEAAVEAFAAVRSDFPPANLSMIGPDLGDGSLQRAQARSAALGLNGSVHFSGALPKPAVAEALRQADIFLNTSTVDNAPVTVVEAMAAGLCVISNNCGGMPDLLERGRAGILVRGNSVCSFASAAQRVIDHPEQARALSTRARQVADRARWENVLPLWQSIFAQALRRSSSTTERSGPQTSVQAL